jgi:hypothetical protein
MAPWRAALRTESSGCGSKNRSSSKLAPIQAKVATYTSV